MTNTYTTWTQRSEQAHVEALVERHMKALVARTEAELVLADI